MSRDCTIFKNFSAILSFYFSAIVRLTHMAKMHRLIVRARAKGLLDENGIYVVSQ